MKGIALCAECAYYSMKKHCCTRGASVETDPKAPFYDDCPLPDTAPVQQWIPVSERLPEKEGSYIVRTTTGAVTTARFYEERTFPPTIYRDYETHRAARWASNRNVTHWMPRPEPPEV